MWLGGLIHEINRLSHLKVDAPRICGFSLSSSGWMDEIPEIRLWGQPAGRFLLPFILLSTRREVFTGVEDTGLQSTFFSGDSEVFYYRRILLFGA